MQSSDRRPPARTLSQLGRAARSWRAVLGAAILLAAIGYLSTVVDLAAVADAAGAVVDSPLAVAGALAAYAAAFGLRTWAWSHVLPGLPVGQSWAALHVSLLGNHVLPLRLGEVLRVTSVVRRTSLPLQPVLASTVALRCTDLLTVVALALVTAPATLTGVVGAPWVFASIAVVLLATGATVLWLRRLGAAGAAVQIPGPAAGAAAVGAWLLEATVVLAVADASGLQLSYAEAVGVTAVTIVAQAVAVTPGGIGSYEAAGTVGLVAVGVPAADALAVVVVTHALKTAYAVGLGGVAMFLPAPGWWGHWRLPHGLPGRPAQGAYDPSAPVVAFLPAHNEESTVGAVVRRIPDTVAGHSVCVVVVDDGSTDATAARAEQAGARVVRMPSNRGLGAAFRRGLAEAVALGPACVVYLDADGEYAPEDLPALAAPVLLGTADYVVGSRFAGTIDVMRHQRRLGNHALTAWVRWMTRLRDLTDGQSGFRAFSPAAAAAAEVVHDYNYAQVLTLDLLAKGFVYAEVPIRYSFRTSGTSFVRLHDYLRKVLPAVHAELNDTGTRTAGSVLDDVAAEPVPGR